CALDNRGTYQDRTGDMPMFNVTYLRKDLLFWNGNMPEGARQVRLVVSENEGPFLYSPDLYYMGSGDLSKIIDLKVDDRIYHFDQFDLKYNRPDIIMERLGYADSNLINAYYRAYQKRLKKMDFDEGMLEDDFHVPDIQLTNKTSMPLVTDQTSVQL